MLLTIRMMKITKFNIQTRKMCVVIWKQLLPENFYLKVPIDHTIVYLRARKDFRGCLVEPALSKNVSSQSLLLGRELFNLIHPAHTYGSCSVSQFQC